MAPLILQNLKKILKANPELPECAIIGSEIAHLSLTKYFWYKPLLLLSFTYWPFSLCKIKKKILQQIQSYKDASFLGQKWFIWVKQKKKKIINNLPIGPFYSAKLKKKS